MKTGAVEMIDLEREKIEDQEEEEEVEVERRDFAEERPESRVGVQPPNQAPMMKPLIKLKKTAEIGTEI